MTGKVKGALSKETSALVIVDIQQKLFNVMSGRDELLESSRKLVSGLRALNIPIIITEQYPKGIGHTVEPLIERLENDYKPISKVEFSCFGNDSFKRELKKLDRVTDLIIIGIEAHVCIFQTVMDALDDSYSVHLVTDAVSSRTKKNRKIGIKRCEDMGAFLASTEMILFQLIKTAAAPEFKEISRIVK